MKLYDLDISPFAARVRMQIRHKKLAVEVCEPPHELRSAEFMAAFPLGKVPVLDLMNGETIGESTAIMNYLETLFPQPAMRPSAALASAQDDMLIRYTDNHMSPALSPLFKEFFVLNQDGGEAAENLHRFDLLKPELQKLDGLLAALPGFRQRDLQLGDLCLVTHLYYALMMAEYFGEPDLLSGLSNVNAWHEWVGQFDAVAHEINVMNQGFQARLNKVNTA